MEDTWIFLGGGNRTDFMDIIKGHGESVSSSVSQHKWSIISAWMTEK